MNSSTVIAIVLEVGSTTLTNLAYLREHDVMVNVLRDRGYPSIGCEPCTARPIDGQGTRSGRWRGSGKNECGIHLP